ncbi:hypothetical protein [Nocardioides panacisoli]|uniref:Uncharacterized protein n=1 Tax=Nocardioides panacisoli TaxID=627624 RepID=A0ABP7J6V5_9ACTN
MSRRLVGVVGGGYAGLTAARRLLDRGRDRAARARRRTAAHRATGRPGAHRGDPPDRGLDVVTVDIEEFEKLEGCVTCLSVRVRA